MLPVVVTPHVIKSHGITRTLATMHVKTGDVGKKATWVAASSQRSFLGFDNVVRG